MKRFLSTLPFVASAAIGATAGWAIERYSWLLDEPDEHEVRYAQKIIDLGGAEVYRQEWHAAQARKDVGVGAR